jgi:hypothetical protein
MCAGGDQCVMQSEILRLLDAPLQQGFAAHVIGERFRFLQ